MARRIPNTLWAVIHESMRRGWSRKLHSYTVPTLHRSVRVYQNKKIALNAVLHGGGVLVPYIVSESTLAERFEE